MRAPGIYPNVEIDTYHAEEGISSTGIHLILKNPYLYWAKYINYGPHLRNPISTEYHFSLGKAFHTLLLEPHKFEDLFYLAKDFDLTQEYPPKNKEKVSTVDWINMKFMKEAVQRNTLWLDMHDEKFEHSLYWDTKDKIRLRARPDIFTQDTIIDIKTTNSISNFNESILQYGYLRQAAMQVDGLSILAPQNKARDFYFLIVENKFPFRTLAKPLNAYDIEKGREQYLAGVARYAKCLHEQSWPNA